MGNGKLRVVLALVAASLCSAAGAASASAGAKPVLHLEAGGTALAPGAPITVSGTSFTLATSAGKVSCTDDELDGSMTTNLSKKDLVTLESGLFSGEGEGGSCTSTYASPRDEVTVVPELLPWELRLDSKGAAELKAPPTKLKGGILLRLEPLNPPSGSHGAIACLYNSAKVKASFATDGQPVVVSFANVTFHEAADSAPNCGKGNPKPTASGTFELSSEGLPVTATLGP